MLIKYEKMGVSTTTKLLFASANFLDSGLVCSRSDVCSCSYVWGTREHIEFWQLSEGGSSIHKCALKMGAINGRNGN